MTWFLRNQICGGSPEKNMRVGAVAKLDRVSLLVPVSLLCSSLNEAAYGGYCKTGRNGRPL